MLAENMQPIGIQVGRFCLLAVMRNTLPKFAFTILCVLLSSILAGAQQIVRVPRNAGCNFFEAAELIDEGGFVEFAVFEPDKKSLETIQEILDLAGIPLNNIVIKSANVPNAMALVLNDRRHIWYNPSFMLRLETKANTDWAAVGILAHEVGHHMAGHTLDRTAGSTPNVEIEADQFAGFILFKMSTTLDQAVSAFKLFQEKSSSGTHPPRSSRVKAVSRGWRKAEQQFNGPNSIRTPPVNTRTVIPDFCRQSEKGVLNEEIIRRLMRCWEASQDNQDFESYRANYDSGFRGVKRTKNGGSRGYNFEEWMNDRRGMFNYLEDLDVDIVNMRITVRENVALIEFDQYFRSLDYSDWGSKLIKVTMTNSGARIIYEELLNSHPL